MGQVRSITMFLGRILLLNEKFDGGIVGRSDRVALQ